MQAGSRYIIAAGMSSLCIGLLYFLSLVLGIHVFVIAPVIATCIAIVFRWVLRDMNLADDVVPHTFWAYTILTAGIVIMVIESVPLADKYGTWDAWGIWNLHAKYLSDSVYWRKMFQNVRFDHLDYPLGIPAINGFFIRMCSQRYLMVIPFITSISFTLFIPVLIYLESVKKNMVVAAIIFLLFVTDKYYLRTGLMQYADTPVAFYFLCAFICIDHAGESRKYVALSAVFLGCCMWTKNEGEVLAVVFFLFYSGTFLGKKNIMVFAAAIAVPVVVVLLYKMHFSPDKGLPGIENREALSQVFILSRYQLVWHYFIDNTIQKFFYVMIAFLVYLLMCLRDKKLPGRQFWLLVCCSICFCLVYVVFPSDINWLLGTSQDRLMHQLMPAAMYVFSKRLVLIQFPLPQKQLS